jgi:hypothetical protein
LALATAERQNMDASAISAQVAAEFSYKVAARVMDIAKDSGDSSVALIQAAAKAAQAGDAATEQMVSSATQALDVYA